ncbi:MAG TPA: DEAD/DEAH box helicase [Cellulomonas sp.]
MGIDVPEGLPEGTGGSSPDEGWRDVLRSLAAHGVDPGTRASSAGSATGTAPGARPGTQLGLQLELRELTPRTRDRWNGPTSRTVGRRGPGGDLGPAGNGEYRLGARPVLRTARGWTRGTLTWSNLPHMRTRLGLDPAQHRWFSQLGALHRAAGPAEPGTDADWVMLDDFSNPVLWDLLAQTADLGITVVGSGTGATVRVAARAALGLDAVREAGGVRLRARLTVDDEPVDVRHGHPIATHGVYVVDPAHPRQVLLAPTVAPLGRSQLALLAGPGGRSVADALGAGLLVPAEAADELLGEHLPALRAGLDVGSTDGSVTLPPPAAPVLVLTVRFGPRRTADLRWRWDGHARSGPTPDPRSLLPAGTVPAHWWPADPASPTDPPVAVTLRDVDTAELVSSTLPLLATLPGVRVETSGDRPDYRELRGDPVLTVTTVPTEQHDWFDLGVTVTVDGRQIPFVPLFRALAQGRRRLLLVDGSHLRLDHPVLAPLAELIAEARDLAEWDTGPRIGRHQTSLWADFVDLADEAVPAQEWRDLLDDVAGDAPRPVPLPRGLHAALRPYQEEGFHWLAFLWRHRLGGILADDMGLGKTLQCLALIQHAVEQRTDAQQPAGAAPGARRPFLVVAPTSVTPAWVAEAARFTPGLTVRRMTATEAAGAVTVAQAAEGADVLVTSYALLRLDAGAYQAVADGPGWAGLVLDEAQQVKNPASRVHEAARDLAVPFTVAVTGTPMENSLTELHALTALVAPGLFPSARVFAERYVRPIEGVRTGIAAGRRATGGRDGSEDGGPGAVDGVLGTASPDDERLRTQRLDRLRRRIRPFLLRRTKENVAADLPERQEQVLMVDLAPAHRELYDLYLQRERQKLFGLIDDLDRQRFIVYRSLTLLRMLALDPALIGTDDGAGPPGNAPAQPGVGSAKLDALLDQLDDVLAEGHRALVFSQFTSYLRRAAARLDAAGVPYVYLDGSTTHRDRVVREFRTGTAPVFLISLKAGGTGLTLTEADYVFLLDPWWNPAAEQQAIDRAHRIGQHRNVMVYRLIAAGTIEEKVQALQARKAALTDAVLDEGDLFAATLTADEVRELLA